jgi:hypothetical protein
VTSLAFTLLLRLPDGFAPPQNAPEWTHWRRAASVVPQAEYGDPHDEPPYKRYPGTRAYFSAPAQETLFPAHDQSRRSGRWVRRPAGWSVTLAPEGEWGIELGVDLLEIVRARLAPQVSFGIAHVSVDDGLTLAQMLAASTALATRYRPADKDTPTIAVVKGSQPTECTGSEPLRAMTVALFGAGHEFVALRAYIFAAAQVPAEIEDDALAAWRRALGQGHERARAERAYARNPERDRQRTERFGDAEATFFGRSAALTFRDDPSASLRNIRSYWAETVLFGLLQHATSSTTPCSSPSLGACRLAPRSSSFTASGSPFATCSGGKHPAFTTDVPNTILRHTHRGLETRALYAELESSFSTYVEARRYSEQEVESQALRALQVYGAAFAVVGSAAAIMQVAGEEYLDTRTARAAAILGLIALGVLAVWLATRALRRRAARIRAATATAEP